MYRFFQAGLTLLLVMAACGCGGGRGGLHSAAVKSDGTVWTWGSNSFGMLGDNTTEIRLSPLQVIFPSGEGAGPAGIGRAGAGTGITPAASQGGGSFAG